MCWVAISADELGEPLNFPASAFLYLVQRDDHWMMLADVDGVFEFLRLTKKEAADWMLMNDLILPEPLWGKESAKDPFDNSATTDAVATLDELLRQAAHVFIEGRKTTTTDEPPQESADDPLDRILDQLGKIREQIIHCAYENKLFDWASNWANGQKSGTTPENR